MTEQAEPNESKESTPAALTRWPRDLTDLWAGWPLGPTEWPFRDLNEFIKVEEFIDGDHLVIRAELPGVDPDRDIDVLVDSGVLTIAAERQERNRRSSRRAIAVSSATAASSDKSGFRQGPQLRCLRGVQGRRPGDSVAQTHTGGSLPAASRSNAADKHRTFLSNQRDSVSTLAAFVWRTLVPRTDLQSDWLPDTKTQRQQ
jgi:HSP20 family protein